MRPTAHARIRTSSLFLLVLAVSASSAEAELSVRWLGVAGFAIEDGEDTLLHDPYLSRPSRWRTLFRRYVPDEAVLAPLLAPDGLAPELGRGDLILIGHSHFDHLGDAPWIADRTGATVVGSGTTVAISRGFGLGDEQVLRADPGARLSQGAFEVRVVESRHAKLVFGKPPIPGIVEDPPGWPIHALRFKLGDARGYLVTHSQSGLRMLLLSSAALHVPAIEALAAEGITVDVLLTSVVGRDDDFVRVLLDRLRPRIIVPNHFDDFFVPLADPAAGAPAFEDALSDFEAEARSVAAEIGLETEIRRPTLFERMTFGPPGP